MIGGCRLFTENQVGCFWRTLWSEGLLCLVCCVCELYMVSIKNTSCSTLFSLVEARQGWRDQGNTHREVDWGRAGRKLNIRLLPPPTPWIFHLFVRCLLVLRIQGQTARNLLSLESSGTLVLKNQKNPLRTGCSRGVLVSARLSFPKRYRPLS